MAKKQAIILLLGAFILGFIMIQPFNLFCKATNYCEPIILSYYIPQDQGEELFNVVLEAKNLSQDLFLQPNIRELVLYSSFKAQVYFELMNLSKSQKKNVRPELYVIPIEAKKYIKFYDCLCDSSYSIGPSELKNLSIKFMIKRDIEKDPFFKNKANNTIRIGYKIAD